MKIIDNTDFNLVLEGRIYNIKENSLDKTLRDIAEAQIRSDAECDDVLKQFLLDAEGEFIITIYDKTRKRIILANDILGRLPLYFYQMPESLVISRELKFILPFLPNVTFCKDGILEYLLYGFPFNENTLIEKVRFFPSATYVSFDMISGKSTIQSYHALNIDTCIHRESRKKIAGRMSRIFMEALSKRVAWVNKKKTIVSLSGGFDSRGTLAGLKKLGLAPTAVTAQSIEEHSARQVARVLGAEVYVIPQGQVERELPFADIVFLKDGLDCHPNLAQLYQNLYILRDRFGGDIVYFTGIYGGEITRHSHPTAGLSSLGSLTRYLLNADDSYKYSTKKVAAILQIPEDEIRKHVHEHLETFPEKNIYRKYARFRHEYDMRFAGEAEDRNRYYFWTISPFFAFPFFKYVMSIDENKKTSWLFRDFLFSIDPNTCKAKYFNYTLPLNNRVVLWLLALAEGMVRHVFVKDNLKRSKRILKACRRWICRSINEDNSEVKRIRAELLSQLESSPRIKEVFNNADLPAILMEEDAVKGLDRLRIIFAYMNCATRWHAVLGKAECGTVTDCHTSNGQTRA